MKNSVLYNGVENKKKNYRPAENLPIYNAKIEALILAKKQMEQAKAVYDGILNEIRRELEANNIYSIITEGRVQVTVSEDKAYEVFDTKRFAEEHTRLYKQYLKEPKIKQGAINVTLKEEQ